MRNWDALRERYLRDDLPIRLGGLAANLARIKSFSDHPGNRELVASLVEETEFFIEWTAGAAKIDVAAELAEMQIALAVWRRQWERVWADPEQRSQVADQSALWSDRLLQMSGLLDQAG